MNAEDRRVPVMRRSGSKPGHPFGPTGGTALLCALWAARHPPVGERTMREPRGRILSVAPPVADLEASGPKWRLVVYVKTGSSRLARDFDFHCRTLGLAARLVQDWGHLGAYEVVGDAQALQRLTQRACIRDCHHCLNVRPP